MNPAGTGFGRARESILLSLALNEKGFVFTQ